MITCGFVKEIEFISTYLKIPVELTFHIKYSLHIKINNKIMELTYDGNSIWRENIAIGSHFNVESCDSISRLIYAFDNGGDWTKYCYFE